MALKPRATVEAVRRLGDFDASEFASADIEKVLPIAHAIVMFQMKSEWESSYPAAEVEWAEQILVEAENMFAISRLYKIKADRQLDAKDEDAFTIGSISIQPGGAQQRIFNKDYQFLADKYEMQGQALLNLVIPSNTQVFFKIR